MKIVKRLMLTSLMCLMVFFLFGCGKTETSALQASVTPAPTQTQQSNTPEPSQDKQVSLTISAAASLKDSMEEIKQLYVKEKPNVTVTYNFGASGTLQQQIEQGAPADIFMSAADKQMDALKQKSILLDGTIRNLLENEVVLVVPKDSTLVKDFKDLTGDKVKKIALGEPKSVPAGQYAEEIFTFLQIKEKIQPKVVYGKDVREVLTWVGTGNADAGIVYETDAKVSDKVKIAANAPENSHKPVVYPVAIVKSSMNVDTAKDFLNYLSGDKAKAVFEKYGFSMAK